jgi:hypothetical protein
MQRTCENNVLIEFAREAERSGERKGEGDGKRGREMERKIGVGVIYESGAYLQRKGVI